MRTTRTPLLDKISSPSDLKGLSVAELKQVADELRHETIDAVSTTGGHLGSALGVVELTVALHSVFDTPDDKLVWDVGHQSYPHKIITGRRNKLSSIRKFGGISGFPKRSESKYDDFGTAHSSTSISAILGMALASKLNGLNQGESRRRHIAIIGDGALSAGMAFEAFGASVSEGSHPGHAHVHPSCDSCRSHLSQ